jgi:oleate hydratase
MYFESESHVQCICVRSIDFDIAADIKTATVIHLKNKSEIVLGENDYV